MKETPPHTHTHPLTMTTLYYLWERDKVRVKYCYNEHYWRQKKLKECQDRVLVWNNSYNSKENSNIVHKSWTFRYITGERGRWCQEQNGNFRGMSVWSGENVPVRRGVSQDNKWGATTAAKTMWCMWCMWCMSTSVGHVPSSGIWAAPGGKWLSSIFRRMKKAMKIERPVERKINA